MGELLHGRGGRVRFEPRFFTDPLGTLARDGTLSHLVAELDLEFTAGQSPFRPRQWNEELASFFLDPIDRTIWDKRR